MAFLTFGCSEEEKPKNLIARVENNTLTTDDLNKIADTLKLSLIQRKQIIDNWIENELLALEALDNDLDKDEAFKFNAEYNRKKILAGYFLDKYFAENEILVSDKEIDEYYANRKDDLIFNYDILKLNQIILKSMAKAIEIRNSLSAKLNFKNTVNQLLKENDIYEARYDFYVNENQLEPPELADVIRTMIPGEISYPIKIDNNKYLLTQLISKYEKGNTPTLEFVKELIKERIKIDKQKQLYRDLIKQLIKKYDIEIKEYD